MKKVNIILPILIILNGIFTYRVGDEINRFFTAQLALFLLSLGVLGGILLWEKNKWIGCLAFVYSFGVFKTLLFEGAPKIFIFGTTLVGIALFSMYYLIRHFKFKEEYLKWFLIPIIINILVIYVQKFDYTLLKHLPVKGITGLIGNPGFVSLYLALATPLFLKYCKWGIPFLLGAIIICNGGVGFIACVVSGFVYLYYTNKKVFKISAITMMILSFIYIPFFVSGKWGHKGEAHLRLAMMAGTLDGILENPILGWGVGSYIPVMAQVKPENSEYLGRKFNTPTAILNHPHNEFLFAWWNVGILAMVFMVLYIGSLFRKFTKRKILSFSIIVAGVICMSGYFLRLPTWVFLLTALGIYENEEEDNGKKSGFKKTCKAKS